MEKRDRVKGSAGGRTGNVTDRWQGSEGTSAGAVIPVAGGRDIRTG